MNNEIWKSVVGYEGLYEVSNMGRVRSVDHITIVNRGGQTYEKPTKGKMLIPLKRQHGYLGVQLYGKGGHKKRNLRTMSIHRLVAEAFIENPLGLSEVNHKDEDKTNNRSDNLEWISHKDNTNYGTVQKRRSAVVRNNSRSKAVAQYTQDMELVAVYPSFGEAARQTGFAQGNIWRCIHNVYSQAYGYIWKYA